MRLLLTLLIVAALALLPGPAAATDLEEVLKMQHLQYQGEADLQVAQSGCTTLSQAIESVRNRTGGKVVSAETRAAHIPMPADGPSFGVAPSGT